eukprot:6180426-Pleurochrysis_carterae.AAC.1
MVETDERTAIRAPQSPQRMCEQTGRASWTERRRRVVLMRDPRKGACDGLVPMCLQQRQKQGLCVLAARSVRGMCCVYLCVCLGPVRAGVEGKAAHCRGEHRLGALEQAEERVLAEGAGKGADCAKRARADALGSGDVGRQLVEHGLELGKECVAI